jgi:hypothetical protein
VAAGRGFEIRAEHCEVSFIILVFVISPIKKLSLYKSVGVQEVEAPGVSRQSAHEGGKVVRPTHRPPLPQGDTTGTPFC